MQQSKPYGIPANNDFRTDSSSAWPPRASQTHTMSTLNAHAGKRPPPPMTNINTNPNTNGSEPHAPAPQNREMGWHDKEDYEDVLVSGERSQNQGQSEDNYQQQAHQQMSTQALRTLPTIRYQELSVEEKELMVRFLLENNVKFQPNRHGNYVARVRMYDQSALEDHGIAVPEDNGRHADMYYKSFQNQLSPNKYNKPMNTEETMRALADADVPFDFTNYSKFSSLIRMYEDVIPRARPIAWVMRLIEEIYDARYTHDTSELREDIEENEGENKKPKHHARDFPSFVVKFFSKRYGLQQLVYQTCWDLLYNVDRYRQEYLEVDIFAQFLEESYDPDDLLFFLYVRSVIQRELNFSFRSRWTELGRSAVGGEGKNRGPKPLYLGNRECNVIAKVVFGSEKDELFKGFMAIVNNELQSSRKGRSGKRDIPRIEVTRFLEIALTEYHNTRPTASGEEGKPSSSNQQQTREGRQRGTSVDNVLEERELFKEAERAYEMRMRSEAQAQQSGSLGQKGTSSEHSPQQQTSPDKEAANASDLMLNYLGECLSRRNNEFLDQLMVTARELSSDTYDQVRGDTETRLERHVDDLLQKIIEAAQSGKNQADVDPELVKLFRQILDSFADSTVTEVRPRLEAAAQPNGVIDTFAKKVLESPELREDIESYFVTLTAYAQSGKNT